MFLCTLCLLAAASGSAASPSLCSRHGTYLSCVKRSLRRPPALPAGVEHLNLNWNNISRLDKTSFSWTGELRVLTVGLQDSQWISVGANAFGNLPNLTFLDLGGNSHLELDLEAFAGLGRLQSLWLDYNGLGDSVLQRGYFRDLRSLHTLVLQGNQLQYLRPDPTFSGLRPLQYLDFSFNQLREICRGDLAHIQHRVFRTFNVSRNRLLYADQSFDWARCGNPFHDILLYTLDISGTSLGVRQLQKMFLALTGTLIVELRMGHLPIGASFGYDNLPDPDNQTFAGLADSSVTILQLTNTFLFSLQPRVFAHLPALKILTLSSNRINLIHRGAFSGLGALVQLNLSHNLLGEIYSWTFRGLENVSHIDLQHNHIGIIQMDSFRGLTQLVTLNLRENSLPKLPGSRPLPGLRYLLLGHNRLGSVYGLQAAPGSVFLDFSNNVLVDLQVFYEIMKLPAVTYLLLRDNRVSRCQVPPGATVPTGNRLLHLDLSGNFLQVMWAAGQCQDLFHNLSNLTELLLQGNYLTQLPRGVFGGLVSLKRLNLSLNSLSQLSRDLFPGSLEILDLSNNRLVSPDPDTFSSVRRLDLRFNQYICDCGLNRFLRWFNRTQADLVGPRTQLRCAFPEGLRGVALVSLSPGCGLEDTQFALSVALTTLLLTLLASVLLYVRCRTLLLLHCRALARTVLSGAEAEPTRAGYRFDAYLCFSGRDLQWVMDTLLSNLEKKRLQLCVGERDFTPGEDHLTNIRDAIWGSRKTVCVVSRRFLEDGWCLEAFNIAQSRLYHELKDVVVVLVVGSLRDYQLRRYRPLRSYLQSREYLRWPAEPRDQRWLLERLADKIRQDPERRAVGPRRKGFLGLLSRRKPAGDLRLQRVATVSS
ncbi:toll-like receptor 5 [Pristis pectinata]|uniref:toll-like receptor 5 n=1 Tax=Pristis pectinata TaxID=685728 RepID=UPI00223DC937|nr:toll-like receptor 5 [Pristis pectinata]XP_051880080.1 toll-like receptor 5 [Pristis pectinata]XP_051880081.1 toll-like receptor 5 [Pristis pectinata]